MSEIIVEIGKRKYIVKADRKYTETDEWVLMEKSGAKIGITDYAQKELKDIVAIEMPELGRVVKKGEELGMIDSVKATSPYYAPISGKIVAVNKELETSPELLNKDPYGAGWILVIEPSDPSEYEELLTPEKYVELIKSRKRQ
ncbi:MAG: glycine cleavage system protein GcvH [Desulfurococcaceae archaeon]